jgi:hypothetical protein
VLRAVDYLSTRAEIDPKRISVIGHGSAGLAALHAAALDDRLRSAAVTASLISYADVVQKEIYTQRYSTFVPGALRKYDLPELASLVAPRPLVVINAVDELQRPVELERAVEAYKPARSIFDLTGAGRAFSVEHAIAATEILETYRGLLLAPDRPARYRGTKAGQ